MIALAVFAATPVCAWGNPTAADVARQRFQDMIETHEVPLAGTSVTIMRQGDILLNESIGVRDVAAGVPTTPETRYRLYSVAKPFTAAAALKLAEDGLLDLDAPIGEILTSLPEHVQGITTRQLMANRSGIRHYRQGEWVSVSNRICTEPNDALPDFIGDPLEFAPGTDNVYSTFGFVLLSAVLQAAVERSYQDIMNFTVFARANMESIALDGRTLDGFAVSEFYLHDDERTPPFMRVFDYDPTINASCKFGGGGFVGTSIDLARFGDALLNGKILSNASLNDMWTLRTPNSEFPGYALGFFDGQTWLENLARLRREQEGISSNAFPIPVAWFHGGSGAGGYSILFIYPDDDLVISMASNTRAGGNLIMLDVHAIAEPFLERGRE